MAGAQWMGPFRTPEPLPLTQILTVIPMHVSWPRFSGIPFPLCYLSISSSSVVIQQLLNLHEGDYVVGHSEVDPETNNCKYLPWREFQGTLLGELVNVTGKGRRVIQEARIVRQLLWAVGSVSLGTYGR